MVSRGQHGTCAGWSHGLWGGALARPCMVWRRQGTGVRNLLMIFAQIINSQNAQIYKPRIFTNNAIILEGYHSFHPIA